MTTKKRYYVYKYTIGTVLVYVGLGTENGKTFRRALDLYSHKGVLKKYRAYRKWMKERGKTPLPMKIALVKKNLPERAAKFIESILISEAKPRWNIQKHHTKNNEIIATIDKDLTPRLSAKRFHLLTPEQKQERIEARKKRQSEYMEKYLQDPKKAALHKLRAYVSVYRKKVEAGNASDKVKATYKRKLKELKELTNAQTLRI